MRRNSRGVIFGVGSLVSVAFLALVGLLVLNRQYLLDQWSVWQYQPTVEVQSISQRAGLSAGGRFYLYASHTEVNNATEFNTNCARLETNNAVLGCYSNRNIFIYDISNQELDGVEEVTAAHEMLHAIWDRMNEDEKNRIGAILEAEYEQIVTPALEERMTYYSRNESGELQNELHSILGTEVSGLNPELEKYYAKYFEDRQKVTTLHAQYEQVFTQLSDESESLYNQLIASGNEIEDLSLVYNQAVALLSADIQSFNDRANNGSFESVARFNTERAALVTRTREVDAQRDVLNQKITAYNDDYARYQALTVRRETLNRSIDSSLAPAPSL